ncbi:MAG: SWIM zinc finger family protein [Thermofilaceae archaeon]
MSDERASMVSKAAWLIKEGRVVKISDLMYYVMGRKNRHIVRVVGDALSCTCPGFRGRGICSHVIAVSTIMKLGSKSEFLDEVLRARVEKELKFLRRKP